MDVATLGLKIDGTGALKGVGDVEARLLSLEGASKKVGQVLTAGFVAAGAALGAFAVGVLKNTGEADAAYAQLEARVKSTGGAAGFTAGELREMAGSLQDISTYGDEAIQDMQSLLLTFTNVRGDQFERAQRAALDLATALGGDLKGAALQVGKALNDPIGGVTALSRAGVQLSDSQKQAIEQMVAMGDVAGAQSVILKELETQMGGAAEAARKTMPGALAALKNAFGDLLEVPAIISPITNVLNTLTDTLTSERVQSAVADFAKAALVNLAAFANGVAEVVGLAASGLGAIAGFFGRLSGPDSPLNRFARAMEGVATSAANSQVFIDGLVDSLMTTTPAATTAAKALATYEGAVTDTLTAEEKRKIVLKELAEEQAKGAAVLVELYKTMAKPIPLPKMDDFVGGPVDVIIPVEKTQGKLESFFGWLVTEGQLATENLGSAFMETFSNIAARGKVAFGDLFNTIGGLFKAGSSGAALFGGLGVGASILTDVIGGQRAQRKAALEALEADMEAFDDALATFTDSFRVRGSLFSEEMRRIGEFMANAIEQAGEVLTITARRALDAAGGDVDQAIANRTRTVRRNGGIAETDVAIKQLEEYKRQMAAAAEATREATEAAREARKQRNEDMREDLRVRMLVAQGRDAEADALRQQLRFDEEWREAMTNGADLMTIAMLAAAQGMEAAALAAAQLAEQERELQERRWTIAGLDAAIARESGNGDEADAIERQIARDRVLAEVTDDVIRAKYEELWALQDVNRAVAELAAAAEQAAKLQMMSEDLEVRRLVATGKSIEAEARRFELEQARELREAERAFASGEITEDILAALREVLGLEASAFAERQTMGGASTSATPGLGGRTTQVGPLQAMANAQVADIDRVVGVLNTIASLDRRMVELLTALVRGGGIVGVVNSSLQNDTTRQRVTNGNIVVS